jgi:Domain of unknown function (DUF4436)
MDKTSVGPASVGASKSPKHKFNAVSRRAIALASLMAVILLAYISALTHFGVSGVPKEVEFGAPPGGADVALYLQPIQIDALNDSLQVRISVVPARTLADAAAAIADRDFLMKIKRGKQIEHVQVKARQPLPEVTFDFDLDGGNIRDYPFDHYVSNMTLAASQPNSDGTERPLSIHATAWEGLLGFNVKVRSVAAQHPDELPLQFEIRRTGATLFFGLAIYGAMFVMAICALSIGGFVFIGIRRIEVTLIGALGAMIFALPALRNALPGSPPLGVWADILVFFWAELIAIAALCIFVVAWARHGSKP